MEYARYNQNDERLLELAELPLENGIALAMRTTGYSLQDDEIIELSDDLFRLCQCNERRPFRDPDWIGKYGSRLRPID